MPKPNRFTIETSTLPTGDYRLINDGNQADGNFRELRNGNTFKSYLKNREIIPEEDISFNDLDKANRVIEAKRQSAGLIDPNNKENKDGSIAAWTRKGVINALAVFIHREGVDVPDIEPYESALQKILKR
jgi:hypothetical protein